MEELEKNEINENNQIIKNEKDENENIPHNGDILQNQHSSSSTINTRYRVKVYQLDNNEEWEDKGTGHVKIIVLDKIIYLQVKSEKDPNIILLESKIFKNIRYDLQQGTLIVWNDPETDTDLALSFQEAEGCKDICDKIKEIQQSKEDYEFENNLQNEIELPPVNLNNLSKILDLINESNTLLKKERLSMAIIRENYIKKLIDLFNMCEDLEVSENLSILFQIFKGLILLNDTTILEECFSDGNILDIMGPLEYDPELPKKANHRDYLKNHVIFKQVIPFENEELVTKIHQTFRIQYLKDVVLARVLDDGTFSTLSSLIFFNNVEIVSQIQNDEVFLKKLFSKFESPDISKTEEKDLFMFLQELCNLAKNLQLQNRTIFYRTLNKYGFCNVLEKGINNDNISVKLSCINIMENILFHDASLLRTFILSEKTNNFSLFNKIIEIFLNDKDMGIRLQLTEILKNLLDTNNIEPSEKDEFLEMFYTEFITQFTNVLESVEVDSTVKENICDIISFCTQNHGFRIRNYLLSNNVIAKVTKLMKLTTSKPLILASIRFIRTFVGMKDDFYNRYISKNNIFEPIIEIFQENKDKYNLLNSAIIELFEFIRKQNIKHLIQYTIEKFGEFLQKIDYVETFKLMLLKNEQNQESSDSTISPKSSLNNSKEILDQEEEEYFKDDDNENDINKKKRKALVDYEDDEDDENKEDLLNIEEPNLPPLKKKEENEVNLHTFLPKKSKINFNIKTTILPNEK